jgi:predicted Zn-dependent protease
VVAALPTALVQAKFSRQFESEADAYAARILQQHHMSPHWLGTILTRLDEQDKNGNSVPDFLNSHPSTPERVQQLKALSNQAD